MTTSRNILVLAAVGTLFLAGCGKKESASQPETNPPSSSGNPLTAPVDYIGAVGRSKQVADKVVTAASVSQAIQMFQAQEGRNPQDLQELVSKEYLPQLPPAPRNMKYDYNAQTGQLRVVPGP